MTRRGAAPTAGARQRLRAREGRRRPGELLPGRQPQRAARAGAAVDRRPGRRRAAAVPRAARHHRHLGGPRARRGRADRRARGRDADPPGRPDRGAVAAVATCSPCTSPAPTGSPAPARARWPRSGCWSSRSAARYHQVLGDDVPEALLAFARAENATQLVLGDSRRPALGPAARAGHRRPPRSASPATSTSTSSPTGTPARAGALPPAAAALGRRRTAPGLRARRRAAAAARRWR